MGCRVLAVGIDAAEPSLVLELIEQGKLPALARLREEGSWAGVRSPAHIGSGAVWPTFMTGTEPDGHGVFGDWNWDADAMGMVPARRDRLDPFWSSFERGELTAGVLDVEFAPHVGLSRGFEVTEWGSEYSMQGRTVVSPPGIAHLVERNHPFDSGRYEPNGEHGPDRLKLAGGCVKGAALRGELALRLLERAAPDLALVVFVEAHRAGHDLWHTVEPDHPLYADLPADGRLEGQELVAVYSEIDRQIGRLAEAVGDEAAVVVFSLHGMRPAHGISMLLGPALAELGFAHPHRAGRSPRDLVRNGFGAAKRATPGALKRLYHRSVPRDTRYRLAAPTMLPVMDWSRTRAFALPPDQHGWLRVNLIGREAQGAVAPADYDRTCEELEEALTTLHTQDGRPLVRKVLRADPSGTPPALLPDLVVNWTDAALDRPVRVREPAFECWPVGAAITGQHAPDGFCLARGINVALDRKVDAAQLHGLLLNACGR